MRRRGCCDRLGDRRCAGRSRRGDPPAGDAAGDPRDPVPAGEGAVKPPPFTYHAPASLTEALGLLRSLENARLLAGGQSLMPMMNMRYAQPDHIIDINNVPGLSYVRADGE